MYTYTTIIFIPIGSDKQIKHIPNYLICSIQYISRIESSRIWIFNNTNYIIMF